MDYGTSFTGKKYWIWALGGCLAASLSIQASASSTLQVRSNLDTDADGVINQFDLDADNDGILDSREQQCSVSTGLNTQLYAQDSNLAIDKAGTIAALIQTGSLQVDVDYRLTGTGQWSSGIRILNDADLGRLIVELQPKGVSEGNGLATYVLKFSEPVFIDDLDFGGLEFYDHLAFRAYDVNEAEIELAADNFTTFGSVVSAGNDYSYVGNLENFIPENLNEQRVVLSVRDAKVKRLEIDSKKASTSDQNNTAYIRSFNFCTTPDTDKDGIADYLDLDSDNDGLPDNLEAQSTQGWVAPNGVVDSKGVDTAYPIGLQPINSSGTGAVDYLSTDSDGDGITDTAEAGLTLSGVVGQNGLDSNSEAQDNYEAPNGTLTNLASLPNSDGKNEPDLREPNLPIITVDNLGGDNVINSQEDDSALTVSGTTTFVPNGETVTVTLNGKTYTATVTDNTWQLDIPATDLQALPASTNLTATVSNGAGAAKSPVNITIGHTLELPAISLNTIASDNVINSSEDDAPLSISGTTTNVENGETVTVTLNGKTYSTTVTDNKWQLDIPANDLQALPESSTLTATVSNKAGDAATPASVSIGHTVKLPTIGLNTIAGDNVINSSEDDAPLSISGTTTNVENGETVTVTLNGQTYNTTVTDNKWQLEIPAADLQALPESSTLTATVSNKAGDDAAPAAVNLGYQPDAAQDLDSDGLPDDVEGNFDFDKDGQTNNKDTDSDNDGIPDAVEAGNNPNSPFDTDADGQFDFIDTDSDNDGILDAVEVGSNPAQPADTDGDGLPDYRDTDSDNDGILDSVEGAGDVDDDGIPNYLDKDSDGDGLTDNEEAGEGKLNDSDNDGALDFLDADSDNDGLTDAVEVDGGLIRDTDGDGIADYLDADSDNDGILDAKEVTAALGPDSDSDGVYDRFDADANNDGLTDTGKIDADNDGIDDTVDAEINGVLRDDLNNDGIADSANLIDTDGDGLPNSLDVDSDNDGLTDLLETRDGDAATLDENGDGRIDDLTDANNNGVADVIDSELAATDLLLEDTDGDGWVDYLDLDSDADGLTDLAEAGLQTLDPNGDGIIGSGAFADNNGNGLADLADPGSSGTLAEFIDDDLDGTPNGKTVDSNADGITDLSAVAGDDNASTIDANNDGRLDDKTDSNNDGLTDEVTGFEQQPDPALQQDGNNNGVPDVIEDYLDNIGITPSSQPLADDFDRDGYPDYLEAMHGGDALNGAEADSNGNGIPNWLEAADTDNNGLADNDADGFSDLLEQIIGTDVNAANTEAELFDAAETKLLDVNRYQNRSIKPVIWLDPAQNGHGVSALGQADGIATLTARIGNYHLFNDARKPATTPVYQWNIEPALTGQAAPAALNSAELELNPALMTAGVYRVQLSVILGEHESVVEHYLEVLTGAGIADNDGDFIANEDDNHSANIGQLHSLETATGYLMDAASPIATAAGTQTDEAVRLRAGNLASLAQAPNAAINANQVASALNQLAAAGVSTVQFNSVAHSGVLYDYEVTNLPYVGASTQVVLPLVKAAAANDELQQFDPALGWSAFVADAENSVASATWLNGEAGKCPAAGSSDYTAGIIEGSQCLQITVQDGGANDADDDSNDSTPEDGQGDVNGNVRGSWSLVAGDGAGGGAQKPTGVIFPEGARIETGVRGIGSLAGGFWLALGLVLLRLRTGFTAAASLKLASLALLLPLSFTALSPNAQAQVDCYKGEQTAPADVHLHRCAGWYAGLGAGVAFLEPNILGGAPETLDKTSDFLLPTVFVGYDITRHWSVEAHYSRQGEATFESGAAIGYQHYGASALFHFPSHLPGWHVLGKLGLSRLDTEVASGRDDNGPFNLAQVKNTSLSFGAGVEYMAESNWGARLEAFSVDDDSNQITLSVVKRFGRHIDLPEPEPIPEPEPEPEPEPVPEPTPEPEPEAPVCLVPDSVLDGIYFVTNSAELTDDGIALLASIVEKLTEYPGVQLAVRAYTDSRGSEEYNLQLSQQRAETVKTFFASQGLTDVDAQGLGEVNPVADNETEEGRAKNRRVEIDIVSRECK